ncbi:MULTISPECIES: MliC family protein [Pasteurellaceae]|uniref:Opacity-associated protein OapB n=1 Tax=Rodentibacter genomosp. 1 TaxID=1908264 RepID=A0A1V3J4I2_9PAST|nr:MliC family protein [Rodentibacter genomosp. 1]MBF0751457.1 MliC family protein [Pasteurella sp. 19428wF3_WM03]OOF50059.1 Opacity-associated protein OapB [Rodentibacter genomosp. 1]TFU52072.1 Opacity-associated protein OapB [Pasteurella sp. WM03]
MLRKTLFILTALLFGGCAHSPLLSEQSPQKMAVQKVDKASQIGSAKLYFCKDDKEVRVVYSAQKRNKKMLKQVSITFNQVTEKLTQMISERGKNYGNIRWTWLERNDFSTLKNSLGDILAEQCVLKSSAPSLSK